MGNFLKEEKGVAIIYVALAMVALLCITGLAIDGGLLYMTKSKLQKTANAAVLSGAQELTNSEEQVNKVVNRILADHGESSSRESLLIVKDKKVRVVLLKKVKPAFVGLFGFETVDVRASAAASLAPMGRAAGVAPLGVHEDTPLNYGTVVKLKTDSSGSVSGVFGVLALNGPGAKTYEENLRYGYQQEIKVGEIIPTETGNIAGKTRTVVQELINGCTSAIGDLSDRDCSRVILIPVYKPYQFDSNQLKNIQVKGFAYFYITEPMSNTDTSITGMFIKWPGTGFYEEGSIDRGAYAIRLTE
ncbi:pilus assembly protein TadG-related protein [Neobacillus sp. YIM B06451]|uniref:pilus assembly protein TadG-related protein n=1 Tax=Neobacillus sp. YIM B06451 TaxID=3070994 RepID=UPI00292E0125|nr:pilus assembly protein TadG-related protein [Neobacillus sp. YIM B06451]